MQRIVDHTRCREQQTILGPEDTKPYSVMRKSDPFLSRGQLALTCLEDNRPFPVRRTIDHPRDNRSSSVKGISRSFRVQRKTAPPPSFQRTTDHPWFREQQTISGPEDSSSSSVQRTTDPSRCRRQQAHPGPDDNRPSSVQRIRDSIQSKRAKDILPVFCKIILLSLLWSVDGLL